MSEQDTTETNGTEANEKPSATVTINRILRQLERHTEGEQERIMAFVNHDVAEKNASKKVVVAA